MRIKCPQCGGFYSPTPSRSNRGLPYLLGVFLIFLGFAGGSVGMVLVLDAPRDAAGAKSPPGAAPTKEDEPAVPPAKPITRADEARIHAAVNAWLKENLPTGEWEEIKWWEPESYLERDIRQHQTTIDHCRTEIDS